MDAIPIYDDTNIINDIFCKILKEKEIKCVFVDEAQFLKRYHIDNLLDIVDYYKVPVICYGLNSDYKNNPFEGSSHLMAVADVIEEIKSICWCGKKATTNARIIDNKIIKDGDQILIGGNESYISLCRYHFKEGKINGN